MTENKNSKIRIIFAGTPDFAVPSLKALASDDRFEVSLVICSPDKKVGRKQILNKPAVKQAAEALGLQIAQPAKIKEFIEEIREIAPDLFVVIAYGQIIPQAILDIPKYGCINVHGSLLPRYRGASCVQAAIKNQDPESGITVMQMDAGLDTGPIIKQFSVNISQDDNSITLSQKLSDLAGQVLIDTLLDYIEGRLKPKPQDNDKSSYVGITKKEDGHVDWNQSPAQISALWRAMQPWPGIYTDSQFGRLKLISLGKEKAEQTHPVGTIYSSLSKLFVQCGNGSLEITSIQIEGGKPCDAKSFINGHSKYLNTILT